MGARNLTLVGETKTTTSYGDGDDGDGGDRELIGLHVELTDNDGYILRVDDGDSDQIEVYLDGGKLLEAIAEHLGIE